MNKQIQITLTEEQLQKIKDAGLLDEEKGDWYEPKEGEEYYAISEIGVRNSRIQPGVSFNLDFSKRNQVFRTEAEAEKADQWRIAYTKILKWKSQNCNKWEWKEGSNNFFISKINNSLEVTQENWSQSSPLKLYFVFQEDAQACLHANLEEWKILFNLK